MAKRAPMTQAERSAKATAKREALRETELRHRVRPGIRRMLDELMARHGIEQQAEAIQLLIMNAHAMSPNESARLLCVPRHDISLDESVARWILRAGAKEASILDSQDE